MNPAEFANIARTERNLWWFRGMEAILKSFIAPITVDRRPARVLEAGCGTGHMSRLLADVYGWPMFPSDLSLLGLSHAKALGLDRLTQLDLLALPYRDRSFDIVVSLDVIAHLVQCDDERAFREFARVLQPGGTLILRTAALEFLRSRHSLFVDERQRYSAGRIRHLCRVAGLTVRRLTYANSLLLPVALAKFRVWEPLTNAPPASGLDPPAPWLNRALELPLRLEASLIGRGLNLPLGQSLLIAASKPG